MYISLMSVSFNRARTVCFSSSLPLSTQPSEIFVQRVNPMGQVEQVFYTFSYTGDCFFKRQMLGIVAFFLIL